MARNRELTWHKARGCWRKVYHGKVHYLSKAGKCRGPDDRKGYEKALLYWLSLKAKIDGEAIQGEAIQAPVKTDTVEGVSVPFASSYAGIVDKPTPARKGKRAWSIAETIKEYLDSREKEWERGQISGQTYRDTRDKLADFVGFAAHRKLTMMEEVDAHACRHYGDAVRSLPPFRRADGTAGKPISVSTAQKRLVYFRAWMEWAYRNEYIERLPRNLDRTFIRVEGKPEPEPVTLSTEEVRELFTYASQRCRLYISTALNFGFTQADLASLKHSEIDWENWELHRSRHKTGEDQHYPIWAVTYELLLRERTDPEKEELVLLDTNGNPLVVETPNKTTAKTNPIGQSLQRAGKRADEHRVKAGLEKRWNGPDRGIKTLRKTAAQWLRDNYPEHPWLYDVFLSHSQRNVGRHYARATKDSLKLLYDALDAMEKHFGLFDLL